MAAGENEARTIRAAENQSLFREVNERVGQLHEGFGVATEVGDWLCECPNTACTERISMSVTEYEAMRGDGNRFAVAPGHEIPELESVVEATERYVLVKKRGAGAETARRLDPRA